MSEVNQNNLIKVGKITSAHSLKGEVKILVFSGEPTWLKKFKIAHLALDGGAPVDELIVERARAANGALIVKFKGVDDRNAAESLKNREVFVDAKLLTSKKGETIFLREILGYEVHCGGKRIGVIEGFDTNGQQDLLVVGDALIPLIKEFIVKIDDAAKIVEMNLPEGLLEVNTK